MIPWILLLAYIALLFVCLPKLFAKAGVPAWKGAVPLYNLVVWNKLMGKPWYWLLLLLVPGINLLMLIVLNVNTSIAFNERTLKQHIGMVLLPWYHLPRLAFGAQYKFVGPIPIGERKRSTAGQWGDAILFAVIVATTFRILTFEAFTIPTESMEKSLLVGDYLFVSKLSYGARLPMTPITLPFTHHTLPFTASTPSFTNWFHLPYKRLPGFGKPERGDAVVFNFPEGDTVVANFQDASYYQLLRMYGGRANIVDQQRLVVNQDGRMGSAPTGGLLIRPIDKQENYIKRCVAIAGDSLEVRDGVVFVNGKEQPLAPTGQYAYAFKLNGGFNRDRLKEDFDISYDDQLKNLPDTAEMPLIASTAEQLAKKSNVKSMHRLNKPRGFYHEGDGQYWPVFPHDPRYDWSEDNFGPLWIPKAGATLKLTLLNLPLYERAIRVYENNTLEVKGSDIYINGAKTDSYTFKQDYYWMMGDNRHRSLDARFWGFVPFDHVVGKAVLVWITVDKDNGGFPFGMRWKRMFSLVH